VKCLAGWWVAQDHQQPGSGLRLAARMHSFWTMDGPWVAEEHTQEHPWEEKSYEEGPWVVDQREEVR
jgi:hypothetical protein